MIGGNLPASEFVTARSSPSSTDPDSPERFTALDWRAELAWGLWRDRDAPQGVVLDLLEWCKLAYLAGWHARELSG